MRTYINYCGKSNSGKSTTLGMVIKELEKHGTITYIEKSKPKTGVVDYRIVFRINEQLVAISTYGDDLKQLFKNHCLFGKFSPKIMVTASHSHENHNHNLYIDNFVYNEVTADNKPSTQRGRFNYHKVQSGPSNELNADYIFKLIMESMKI